MRIERLLPLRSSLDGLKLAIMSPQTQKLLDEVLRLPLQDREFIVAHVSETLDDDFEYTPELAAEIQRREAELDSGAEQPVPHEEAMRLMFGSRNG
jgi:putative addiction module component (TIGR02574 family)